MAIAASVHVSTGTTAIPAPCELQLPPLYALWAFITTTSSKLVYKYDWITEHSGQQRTTADTSEQQRNIILFNTVFARESCRPPSITCDRFHPAPQTFNIWNVFDSLLQFADNKIVATVITTTHHIIKNNQMVFSCVVLSSLYLVA